MEKPSSSTAAALPVDEVQSQPEGHADPFYYWRLCDELTIVQAATLIVGIDPSDETGAHCDAWDVEQQPRGYAAAKAALVSAVNSGRLRAAVRYAAREYGWAERVQDAELSAETFTTVRGASLGEDERLAEDGSFAYRIEPDWSKTSVTLDDLRRWLASRGVRTGFFFPLASRAPDYLDPNHPRYAPKLAAAVNAWLAVDAVAGKSPKQALSKWLREHSAEFDLTLDDGKHNESGIDQCALVANWQRGGGAPKTPGG
jgi:hypothetical protein